MYILHHITYGIILHITSLRIRHELKDMEKTCPARSYWHHVGMQKKQKKVLGRLRLCPCARLPALPPVARTPERAWEMRWNRGTGQ